MLQESIPKYVWGMALTLKAKFMRIIGWFLTVKIKL